MKPMNTHSFGILGGDSRFLYLARYLGERGYSVRAFVRRSGDAGADGVDPAWFCTSLRECAECTASSDGANLSFPPDGGKIPLNTVFASVKKGTRVFAGCCSRYIADLARDAGAVLYDYYTSEELLYKNALLTAEGALFEISSAVCRPFLGLGVTVFGYGRIASLLTKRNARSIPFPHASSGKMFFPQWIFTRRCWSSRHPPASIPPPRKGTG